ncbi:DUF2188 domain-containing protein [Arcobacter lacus]|uniref:DUF2188 domain-containing protein n=1 Tax=Arcobacter lacus TaxID=1912876 RepID=UPI0021BB918D|nr:DUF2188 domain-containing protein [Arcobacter lacus]MCT7910671.1 DUF2188 domain-containing protein [Arcobacter lacus]
MNRVFVSKYEREWQAKVTENKNAYRVCSTQAEARKQGINLAKKLNAEFALHGKDGKIREKNSYGNDSRKVRV